MGLITGLKWKLYALVAAAFILGLIQWRNGAINQALDAEKAKGLAAKLKLSEEMRDAANSVDTDRDGLSDRLRNHEF